MNKYLYSVVLELSAANTATIPATMGHLAHGLFLDLVRQVDPALSTRLHDEPGYRPFTVSPLSGAQMQNDTLLLEPGRPCRLRITLLDGGSLWQNLSRCFLEVQPMTLRLNAAEFQLNRMLSTPTADATGWAGFTDWQTLATTCSHSAITMYFASPTAFSMGDRHFALFPEPMLVWDSLMRVWNSYAPPILKIDKTALREFISQHVVVSDYTLRTTTLHFPKHKQKGFVGTCSYLMRQEGAESAQLAALAEFSRYAGVGSKTTMGMGQVRAGDIKAEKEI
jgi:CRISPR-associated endoribonuclease Cas6